MKWQLGKVEQVQVSNALRAYKVYNIYIFKVEREKQASGMIFQLVFWGKYNDGQGICINFNKARQWEINYN